MKPSRRQSTSSLILIKRLNNSRGDKRGLKQPSNDFIEL